mmetsp:Transcript_27031/g.78459  ORF Transcript_27031/g.78459 Transcript_27031/m.78459 type:complete len:246 (-) Transcript_27031:201-938(-)
MPFVARPHDLGRDDSDQNRRLLEAVRDLRHHARVLALVAPKSLGAPLFPRPLDQGHVHHVRASDGRSLQEADEQREAVGGDGLAALVQGDVRANHGVHDSPHAERAAEEPRAPRRVRLPSSGDALQAQPRPRGVQGQAEAQEHDGAARAEAEGAQVPTADRDQGKRNKEQRRQHVADQLEPVGCRLARERLAEGADQCAKAQHAPRRSPVGRRTGGVMRLELDHEAQRGEVHREVEEHGGGGRGV